MVKGRGLQVLDSLKVRCGTLRGTLFKRDTAQCLAGNLV